MRTYTQLTQQQRYQISAGLRSQWSQARIAKEIGVNPSTVSRELRRCPGRNCYDPENAHGQALGIRHTAHRRKHISGDLKAFIDAQIVKRYTPEQIAGTLKTRCNTSVSFQSIYRYIQRDNWFGGILFKSLLRVGQRAAYIYPRPRARPDRQGPVCNRVFIDHRPPVVEQRERLGDLEIDTVIGPRHQSAILTITDRSSRYLIAKKLSSKTSRTVAKALISALDYYQDRLHTITSDNGSEFAQHETIAKKLGIQFFFAHPYSSWERGTNENTNGLLRRHFPKKTDFQTITNETLQEVVFKLNNTPRKCLGFRTPAEVFLGIEPRWLADIPVALIG